MTEDTKTKEQDKVARSLADVLNTSHIPAMVPQKTTDGLAKEEPVKDTSKENYELTQKTLKELIKVSMKTLDSYKDVADETLEPMAIKSLATLLKTTADITSKLLESDRVKASLDLDLGVRKSPKGTEGALGAINNSQQNNTTIYVGSTAELLKLINPDEVEVTTNGANTK